MVTWRCLNNYTHSSTIWIKFQNMKQFVPKEEKIRKTKSVLFWILSEYLERIPIKDKMVNLEQEINLSYIFQDDGLWVINNTRQKKKNWHLLSTYQMPRTLHTLYHLIPMRTKGGRSYLILQVRTIKLRKIHSFTLSQISMWMAQQGMEYISAQLHVFPH